MTDLQHLAGRERIRVMMVCMGNICRSPAAAVVLQHKLAEAGLTHVDVDSSGTGGWHEGEGANPRSITTWEKRGYRGTHTARQFRREWFEERDLILVMDDNNYETLISRAPNDTVTSKVQYLRVFDPDAADVTVPDPYYGHNDGFELVLDLLEDACTALLDEVRPIVQARLAADRG
mgnify:FL=1